MSKITLTPISNPSDLTSLQNTINNNNTVIQTAFDNNLSRDGTQPNPMLSTLDMNSNQIINLPAPSTVNSPARLIDVVTNPTIVIPATGTSGHVVPYLDGNNTWSGTNTYGTTTTFNGNVQFNGTVTGLGSIPGWQNVYSAKTASYTTVSADNGSTLSLGGNALYPLTFNAASGYVANFVCMVTNADTYPGGRGKQIAINGYPQFILWPGQQVMVFNRGNTWDYFPKFQRWAPGQSVTFFVDTAGSDLNDGLVTGSGALRNIQTGVNLCERYVDWGNLNSGAAGTVSPTAGQIFTETVAVSGATVGSNEIFITGNGGQFTWKNNGANSLLSVGDGGICIISNIAFFSTNNTFGLACLYLHNNAIVDVFANVSFLGGGTNDNAIFLDNHDCICTIGNPITVSNTFSSIVWHDNGGKSTIGAAISPSGPTIVNSGLFTCKYRSVCIVGTQPAVAGWTAIGQSSAIKGGLLDTNGTSIPGGTTSNTGGLVL
jgi:hypothetical protein